MTLPTAATKAEIALLLLRFFSFLCVDASFLITFLPSSVSACRPPGGGTLGENGVMPRGEQEVQPGPHRPAGEPKPGPDRTDIVPTRRAPFQGYARRFDP